MDYVEQLLTTWSAELRRLAPLIPYRIYSEELPSSYFGVGQVGIQLNPGVESGRHDRLPLRTMSLAKGLDALCERHRRVWWPAGGALYFRSAAWYLDEDEVVPSEVLDEVGQEVLKDGKVSLTTLRRVAKLSTAQLKGLNRLGRAASFRNGPTDHEAPLLRALLDLFESLPEAEQKRVLSPDGLPATAFGPALSARLAELVYVFGAGEELLRRREFFRIKQRLVHRSARGRRVVSLEVDLESGRRWPYGWIYLPGSEQKANGPNPQ